MALDWFGYEPDEYTLIYGMPVFPVSGKAPATQHGFKDATLDPLVFWEMVRASNKPVTGIGGATGDIIAIDADLKGCKNGPEILEAEMRKYGIDPDAVCKQRTGGGGIQYFFRNVEKRPIRNSTNADIAVDIRGYGGYVLLPPSVHPVTGRKYELINSLDHLTDATPAVYALIDWIQGKTFDRASLPAVNPGTELLITEGSRNHSLQRLGSGLRGRGFGYDAILASLRGVNRNQVKPPLPDAELQQIAKSVAQYPVNAARAAGDFSAPSEEALLLSMNDFEPEAVKWLWYPIIPLGKISTVQGDPGGGKTYWTVDNAARVTTGEPFPGDLQPRREPRNVILQNGEDGIADTIVPRLIACKADRSRVFMISEEHKALTLSSLGVIETAFKQCRPALFVIDPIQQYLGADKDMHRANEVRPVLAAVARLCAEYETACLLVMHQNKSGEGKAMYRALGSIDFAAIARSQLLIGKDRNNPNQNLIIHTKSSLAPAGPSLAFRIKGPDGIEYLGETPATADDVLKDPPTVKADSALAEAMELIRAAVAEKPVWSSDLEEEAIEKSISLRTLERARKALRDAGEIQLVKAPGLARWYVKRRGSKVAFTDTAPAYETLDTEE